MPEHELLEYLESRIAEQIISFDRGRRYFWRQQLWFTLGTAVLAALTTVLIGIGRMFNSSGLAVASLITSASITVLAAWERLLQSNDLWVQHTDIWVALQRLQAHIDYEKARTGGQLSEEQIDQFFADFEKAMLAECSAWKKLRSTAETDGRCAGEPPQP